MWKNFRFLQCIAVCVHRPIITMTTLGNTFYCWGSRGGAAPLVGMQQKILHVLFLSGPKQWWLGRSSLYRKARLRITKRQRLHFCNLHTRGIAPLTLFAKRYSCGGFHGDVVINTEINGENPRLNHGTHNLLKEPLKCLIIYLLPLAFSLHSWRFSCA